VKVECNFHIQEAMVQDLDLLTMVLLTTVDCSHESVRLGFPLSSGAFVAATDRGDLRCIRTPSGRRLIAKSDLLAFIEAKREARRAAQPQPALTEATADSTLPAAEESSSPSSLATPREPGGVVLAPSSAIDDANRVTDGTRITTDMEQP
jgi:hypothetical protein